MLLLTDAMIEMALNDTVYMTENLWVIIAVLGAIVIFCSYFFFRSIKVKNIIGIICFSLLAVLFILCGVRYIDGQSSMAKSIQNGEWIVHTDTVDRVMEKTHRDGSKDYFMVLEKYGRVSLDGYSEAVQYYSGAKTYVVVVSKGGEYESTGVTYPTDTYTYVGNHN